MERLGLVSKSPEVLNFYLNHSSIYPNIAPDGTGYLDGTDFLKRDTVMFSYGDGVILFWPDGDAVLLEAHFLKRKGKSAKETIRNAINAIPFKKIRAEVPQFNRASRQMVASLGFERVSVKENAWVKDGIPYDLIQYELEKK